MYGLKVKKSVIQEPHGAAYIEATHTPDITGEENRQRTWITSPRWLPDATSRVKMKAPMLENFAELHIPYNVGVLIKAEEGAFFPKWPLGRVATYRKMSQDFPPQMTKI